MEKSVRPENCCVDQISLHRGQNSHFCKSCLNRYQHIPRLTWIRKLYTFTYFQCLSLELLTKRSKVNKNNTNSPFIRVCSRLYRACVIKNLYYDCLLGESSVCGIDWYVVVNVTKNTAY